jgi:hypothetical protein
MATCIMGIYGACKVGFGWPLEDVARYGVQEDFGKVGEKFITAYYLYVLFRGYSQARFYLLIFSGIYPSIRILLFSHTHSSPLLPHLLALNPPQLSSLPKSNSYPQTKEE